MEPSLINEVARELAKHPGGAPFRRSAVSRAYYAAYNVAQEMIASMGLPKRKGDSHAILQRRLIASGDEQLRQIGVQLSEFSALRNKSDYDMSDRFNPSVADTAAAVALADELIRTIREYKPDSDRWNNARLKMLAALT